MLLGARIGAVSSLIGGSIGFFISQAQAFGPFAPLRPSISALIAGMLISGKWNVPAAILSLFVSIWLLLPVGRDAATILVFHFAGLAMIFLLRDRIGRLSRSGNTTEKLLGLFSVSYCANISRHLFGNILLATIYNLESIYFVAAVPITFIEQMAFAAGTTIAGSSLNHLQLRRLA